MSTPAPPSSPVAEPGPVAEPVEAFPPTLREVMLRPWWIGMLAFALVVAGVFAWLGQWQLGRAIDTDPPPPGATETVRPIAEVVEPGAYLPEPYVGQRVEVTGRWDPDNFLIVSSRFNDEVEGFWVTGRLWNEAAAGEVVSLAVAVGWASTREEAEAAASALSESIPVDAVTLTGRLIADEGPALPPRGAPITEMTRMSPAALLGQWTGVGITDVYRPYLVVDPSTGSGTALPDGLVAIDSPAPSELSSVNWLNIFYAVEWAVFAGFAFYMWYRLARDAWEKELEDLEDAAGRPLPAD